MENNEILSDSYTRKFWLSSKRNNSMKLVRENLSVLKIFRESGDWGRHGRQQEREGRPRWRPIWKTAVEAGGSYSFSYLHTVENVIIGLASCIQVRLSDFNGLTTAVCCNLTIGYVDKIFLENLSHHKKIWPQMVNKYFFFQNQRFLEKLLSCQSRWNAVWILKMIKSNRA